MTRQATLVFVLSAFTVAACQEQRGSQASSSAPQSSRSLPLTATLSTATGAPSKAPRFAPGQILVKLKPGAAAAGAASADPVALLTARVPAFAAFRQRHAGVRAQRTLRGGNGPLVARAARARRAPAGLAAPQLQDIFTVQVSDAGADPEALARELASDPAVEFAEPNHLSQIQVVPTDPLYGQQWAHKKTSAEAAWDLQRGSSSVIVAIVDTGVATAHEDLAANIAPGGSDLVDIDVAQYTSQGYTLEAGEDYTVPDSDPQDFFGHGTHCAGIVAAAANNGKGVSGVAPGVKILPVRAGFEIISGGNKVGLLEDDDIANAIIYATDQGADIISMSFGSDTLSTVQQNAITYARSHGVVLVAAAGNSSVTFPFYPASLPGVIAVAATSQLDGPAAYTNYGPWVDLAAPGGDTTRDPQILSTVPTTGGTLTDPSGYRALQGTSMACPYVAGVAALVLSNNPAWTADNVTAILKRSVDPIVGSAGVAYIGEGRINAQKAVQTTSVPNTVITILAPASGAVFRAGSINVTGTVTGGTTSSYSVAWGAGTYPTSWTTFATGAAPASGATLGSLDVTGFTPGTYTLRVTGFENGDSLSEYVRVSIDPTLHAGWPQTVEFDGGGPHQLGWAQAPSIADIDGDGKGDILVLSNTKVYVFKQDGTSLPGWPQVNGLGSTNGQTPSAAAADIDNDGHTEVVVANTNEGAHGSLTVFAFDGTVKWKRSLPGGFIWNMQPVLSDLDGDGRKEIIVKTWDNGAQTGSMMVWAADGSTFGQWPYNFSAQHLQFLGFQSFGAQDIDGDGHKEVITLMNDSVSSLPVLYVWNYDGSLRPGYPLNIPLNLSIFDHPMTGPLIADIDGDGAFEVGFAMNNGGCGSNGGLWVWAHLDGSLLPGWPISFWDQLNGEQASAADLDHDGKVETVLSTVGAGCEPDHRFAVNVLRSDGTPLPGWPQRMQGQGWSQAAIADIDGDGKSEVIDGDSLGLVYAWNIAGALLPGFPKPLGVSALNGTGVKSCPAVGDIDGTGKVALVASTTGAAVSAWNLGTPFNPALSEWRMFQGNAAHAGLSFGTQAQPPVTTTLAPAADAYVRDGSSAGTNFGTAATLECKNTTSAGTVRRTFLRFPLDTVGGNVTSAKLRLSGNSVTSAKAIGAYAISNITWSETGINWNNAPAIGAKQGSSVTVGLTSGYYEWDVTGYVQMQKQAGLSAVSFEMKQDVATTEGPSVFSSREGASPPQLVVVAGATAVDQPPTVAAAPSASPSPVTGSTSTLSVTGADDHGEANLTYTWSAVGTPPAPVSFSANGTNGAKTSLVSFNAAGNYNLQVVIKDAANQTVTAPLAVTVSQTLTTVVVTPATASVATGGTQQFTASGKDQFGATLTSQPTSTWTVSGGGTISAGGLFTAGGTAGGPFAVTAASGGKSGTAQVTITGSGGAVTLSPLADAHVRDGTYAGTNYGAVTPMETKNTASAGSVRRLFLRFAIDGFASATLAKLRLNGNSVTSAKLIGVYAISNTTWVENTITWNNAPAIGAKQGSSVSVGVAPAQYYEWDVTGYIQQQKSMGFTAVTFEVKQDVATTESPSVFSSKEASSNKPELVVTTGGAANQAPTVATAAAASPSPATGTTTALSVLGADDGGEPALTYTWSTTGTPPAAVTFSANGTNAAKNTTATFTKAGSYSFQVVIKDAGNQTVTSPVSVTVSQTLTSVAVTPGTASVATSATQQFSASGRDQFGTALTAQPTFTWTVAGGGTISTSGLFTAGATPGGPFTVTAASGGKSGTAQVTVTSGSTTVTLNAVADAHVHDGTTAGTNYGTATTIEQKNSTTAGNNRRTFVRFDMTSVTGAVSQAKLRLYGSSVTTAKLVGVYAVSDITWGETTITWNNAPAIGAKQGSSQTVGTTAAYVEWDLTGYVQARKAAGDSAVSFEVKQDVANNDSPTTFNSDENTANKPQLVVTSN
jgi:subtilisin family serine protease